MIERRGIAAYACKKITILFLIFIIYIAAITLGVGAKAVRYSLSFCAETEENGMVFYGYKVYGTEKRYENFALKDAEGLAGDLGYKREIIAVVLRGEPKTESGKGYKVIYREDVPYLNAEYYIVKNVNIFGNSLPAKTVFIFLVELYNILADAVCALLLIIIFCGFYVKFIKNERVYIF